ncbi:MAG: hypothetical protein KY455_10450 [Euryarchaeota archaeon]|nr:hypothetical protein [Euryarchaeota archaeon]
MAVSPFGILSLVGGLLLLPLAIGVFLARRHGPANRYLAGWLFFLGLNVLWSRGVAPSVTDPQSFYAFWPTYYAIVLIGLAFYPPFLATLDSPWSRPFRSPTVRVLLWASLGLAVLSTFVWPSAWFPGIVPGGFGWTWLPVFGPLAVAVNWVVLILYQYAVVVAVSAFRRARSPMQRRQMLIYLIGFVVYDVAYLSIPLTLFLFEAGAISPYTFLMVQSYVPAFAAIWLSVVLSYAILSVQIFDIDIKVKWTINRGTVAAVFVAAFFVVSELVAGLLSERIGLVAGVLVTGGLVFLLAPLQRFGARVSDAAMPDVSPTPEYLAFRRFEVYKAALVDSMTDATITERERSILDGLRRNLDIGDQDAARLEADLHAELQKRTVTHET